MAYTAYMSTKSVKYSADESVREYSDQDPVREARRLVRRGHFVSLATNKGLVEGLNSIRADGDLNAPQVRARFLSSRALLGESFDQTGQYSRAAERFVEPDGDEMLVELESGVKSYLRKKNNAGSFGTDDDFRRLTRSRAMYVLQSAISLHRQQNHDLPHAMHLLKRCQQIIAKVNSPRMRFNGVLSLLHYWMGRVYLLRLARDESRWHFHESMRQTEENLRFHLPAPVSSVNRDDERIAFGVYSLSSCMAFGLAELSHHAGLLSEAMTVLQPAVAMLMCTGDNYRCGMARLNMGAAQRAFGGARPIKIQHAIDSLKVSLDLFGEGSNNGLAHRLYEGLAHYQLALAYLYLAQCRRIHAGDTEPGPSMDEALSLAKQHIESGLSRSEKCEASYKNDELKSKLWIVKSRLLRMEQSFEDATRAAEKAIRLFRSYDHSGEFGSIDAWIARGEARLDESQQARLTASQKKVMLDLAEGDFTRAAELANNSVMINAVTGLHISRVLNYRGDLSEARRVYHERWERNERRIENGWIRQLAAEVGKDLRRSDVLTIDMNALKGELKEGEKLYKLVESAVNNFLVHYAAISGKNSSTQAAAIGWTRQTLYNKKRVKVPRAS